MPGGAIEVEFISNFQNISAQSDNRGLTLVALNKFNVTSTCGIHLSHSVVG